MERRIVWDVYSNTVECMGRQALGDSRKRGGPRKEGAASFPAFPPPPGLKSLQGTDLGWLGTATLQC